MRTFPHCRVNRNIQEQYASKITRFQERSKETEKTLRYLKKGYVRFRAKDNYPSSQESFYEDMSFTYHSINQLRNRLKFVEDKMCKIEAAEGDEN